MSDIVSLLANEPFCLRKDEILSLTPPLARVLYFRERDEYGRVKPDAEPGEKITPYEAYARGKRLEGWDDIKIRESWGQLRKEFSGGS